MTKNKFLPVIWDYIVVTFGTILYCLGWTSFLIPGGIASGGGTGLCTIIYFATGIPVSWSFFVLNVILLVIGFLILGKAFGFKTIYVILLSTVLFDVLPKFEFLVVTFQDRLFTAIIGGMVEAVGIGIVLTRGGSTGGTDILAMVVNKYWPVSPGRVYLFADLFIIASVLLIPGKTVNDMVYGYVTMVTFSVTVDWVLLGSKSTVQLLIISSRYSEIADTIVRDMKRGVTALDSTGWYSGTKGKVLLVMCRKYEYNNIVGMVKMIDPKAFISVSSANGVYGEGFDEVKTGISIKHSKKHDSKKKSIPLKVKKEKNLYIKKKKYIQSLHLPIRQVEVFRKFVQLKFNLYEKLWCIGVSFLCGICFSDCLLCPDVGKGCEEQEKMRGGTVRFFVRHSGGSGECSDSHPL